MKWLLLTVFFIKTADAYGEHIKPQKIDINNYPSVVANVKNELADEYNVKSIDSAGLYDLGARCNGQKLYMLTYFDMKITDMSGAKQDVSGLFTGSGGTQVTIFMMADKSKLSILYDEVLLDWWGVVDNSNCAPIKVKLREWNQKVKMEERLSTLIFNGKKYVNKR